MLPHGWSQITAAVTAVVAVLGSVVTAIGHLKRAGLNVVLWVLVILLIVVALAIEGRYAVLGVSLLVLRWNVRTLFNNIRRVVQERSRHAFILSDYPYDCPGRMNRWLIASMACLSIAAATFWMSPESSMLPTIAGYVLTAFALSEGLRVHARNLASPDEDAHAVNHLLFALSLPKKWGEQVGKKFAPLSVFMWMVALGLTFSLVSDPWNDLTDATNAYVSRQLTPGDRGNEATGGRRKPSGAAEPKESDGSPATDPPPATCEDARLRTALGSRGLAEPVIDRVVAARARYSWPTIGCTLSSVAQYGSTVHVVYDGTKGAALIVDDGVQANAAISKAARVAIQQVQSAEPDRQLTGLSSGARAALGRWHVETWSDGSCQLLESRDESVAGVLSFRQTIRAVRTSRRLDAFPMLGKDRAGDLTLEYVAVDMSSPNGYHVVRVDELLAASLAESRRALSCSKIAEILVPIARQVEMAAQGSPVRASP